MAQLPGSHANSRAGSFSAPSPSPGPSHPTGSSGQNGNHPNLNRPGMPLPGGYPYQTSMGPPQPGTRRPSMGGHSAGGMSPQQKPMSFPYGGMPPAGQQTGGGVGSGADGGYQYPPAGSYNNQQQQWTSNAASPSPAPSSALWGGPTAMPYPGYTYQPQSGPPHQSSNGPAAAPSPVHRPSQSNAAPSNPNRQVAPSPAASRAVSGAPPETSAPPSPWGGQQQQQPQQQQQQQQHTSSGRDDPQDAKQVMDVLGGSGIDLRAEEEAMRGRDPHHPPGLGPGEYNTQRSMPSGSSLTSAYPSGSQGQSTQPPISSLPFLQLYPLASFVHAISSTHEIGVEPEVLSTLSTAARIRFRNLLENMIASSRQRCWTTHERPPPLYESGDDDVEGTSRKKRKAMYHQELISDPSKWLTAIEKADRGEEVKARRKRAQRQREAMLAAAATDSAGQGGASGSGGVAGLDGEGDETMGEGGPATPGGDGSGGKKKGKALSAKNVSEDVRRRLANNTAARALGGATTPKWMIMGTGSASSTGAFSTPTRIKGEVKGETNGEAQTPAFGGGPAPAGGLSSLPKPRFGPAAGASTASGAGGPWGRSLAPSGLAGTPLSRPGGAESPSGTDGKINPQGWGDLAQRALAKEEEEKKRRKRVNLQDVYHAVETERRSGIGRGSGEKTTWRWRNLGPEAARKAAASAGGGAGDETPTGGETRGGGGGKKK
ncbi:hypothetical protein BCV69DRAFT_284378 [Microstroma glucosiphilum]|uniref:Transcription initiation factor TFIID subunit 4 n=1 Tax=Pseudomicrostroma glucosiphilum TaxID=1684307 RepID=A0A316U317_9BASI|nr:hypothetical protein BCV69DRAFT_284378 [Pseudomicrostroma glucosiphilum]PWN19228.1 hypothetical protein BCV69DRAFT_284378 [Pseudomicrostroma glucosiphilum]